jgi:hypothetical protein
VSLGKLKRTLHREFTRNPAKTYTLLALLPLAGYFVGPLLWKQLPSRGGESSPGAPAVVAEQGSLAVASGPPPIPRWQDLAEWMRQDSRMRPAAARSARDPFRPARTVAVRTEAERQPRPSAASQRPEDVGLQLMATIVGPTRRLATISGRLYTEDSRVPAQGARIAPAAEPLPDDQVFVLKTIARGYVVLERHGELFRLPIVREPEN